MLRVLARTGGAGLRARGVMQQGARLVHGRASGGAASAAADHITDGSASAGSALKYARRSEGKLVVGWEDGAQHEFDLCWLRDNCPCSACVSESGQKHHRTVVPGSDGLDVLSAEVCAERDAVLVKWADHAPLELASEQEEAPETMQMQQYDGQWLRRFEYSDAGLAREHTANAGFSVRHEAKEQLPEVQFESLVSGDVGVLDWMRKVNEYGFCLVRETPTVEQTVKQVANLVGDCSHTIYGETFDVKAMPKPINIAYSDSALEPHMDLAYFESPPAIQLLHCMRFDDGVKGGDSTFIDAHAVAEEFKVRNPEHFQVLATVPATFQKDHVAREHPVKMFYQRPHLHVNYLNDVTAVFWAPPFEGPLRVESRFVEPYYHAYDAFRSLLMSSEMWDKYGYCFRLREGDLVTFNNRRMLHGRNAFTSQSGERHLQGCYLDVDTYLNKFRTLTHQVDPATANAEVLGAPGETRFGTSSHR